MTLPEIEKLLKQIEEDAHEANRDLSEIPFHVLPAHKTSVQQAKDRLVQRRSLYDQYVDGHAAVIVLQGPGATPFSHENFADLASDVGDTVTFFADSLYKRIAGVIEPTLNAERRATSEAIGEAASAFRAWALNVGVRTYTIPDWDYIRTHASHSKEDLVAIVRTAIRNTTGDIVNVASLKHLVREQSALLKTAESVIPVIVVDAIPEEAEALANAFGNRGITFTLADEPLSENTVVKAFNQLKIKLK
jgi:hypothetical protein